MTEKSIYDKIREDIDNAIEMNQGLTLDWKEAVELRGYIKSLEEMYAMIDKEFDELKFKYDSLCTCEDDPRERGLLAVDPMCPIHGDPLHEIVRKNEIIRKLKEDAEKLYYSILRQECGETRYQSRVVDAHRSLMKELGK